MQGNMMQVIQPNHTISQSTIALIMKLIKKSYKEEEQQEVLNDIVAIVDEVKRDNRISSELIREEVVEKLKGELATKDFVRAEIAGVKQELKQEIAKVEKEIAEVRANYRSLRQEMKFYAIGLGVLIIILQPKVFDFITAFLK
ncbi:hypothetical protein [Helicobacter apodemus]|uniref:DUF1640 domain-containing protein n=1 Tax=Helicobacter apodemus TaxID=135569 RepID=A0A2U8FEX2_9HELI|nr:hypothetical protein [Helicobacter apodemus]AWI34704.1 hypothetical protein CDV25_07945 [Helicobacter apodemus]